MSVMFTPTLSKKSLQQKRNVFLWCSKKHKITMGWHANTNAISTSTAHRWITTIMRTERPHAAPHQFALFPVVIRPTGVLSYIIQQCGSALSRESQENIPPGHYGIYNEDGSQLRINYMFTPLLSYEALRSSFENYSVALSKKTTLPSSIAVRALARDMGCVFTGVSQPSHDFETLVATWIFPPFLGFMLSDDPWLERTYHDDPDACNLDEFMVVTNTLSGCQDVVALFYENKLGVDVDDNYRIVVFDNSKRSLGAAPLKSHVTFINGQDRPSDRYLRLQFQRCLMVSVCGGDPMDDYEDQEIGGVMEELGVFDNTMDLSDPGWRSPLGLEVYAHLVRNGIFKEEDLVV